MQAGIRKCSVPNVTLTESKRKSLDDTSPRRTPQSALKQFAKESSDQLIKSDKKKKKDK
tara:strand:- start:1332 stop:1508 length:177 start_codon:yes stop_codon:yes gene_type:complete